MEQPQVRLHDHVQQVRRTYLEARCARPLTPTAGCQLAGEVRRTGPLWGEGRTVMEEEEEEEEEVEEEE
ncbi:hypothetical protein E2C01_068284 [Portunus trituberculatus]|uniref:Uncharacterized protein n=1 Tax=Portunus trituberculatus TaxID=210409 RepID=A0A5B7HRI3_PORTR|nr:hypothetical protein [Portunus trituberculatus]